MRDLLHIPRGEGDSQTDLGAKLSQSTLESSQEVDLVGLFSLRLSLPAYSSLSA
jgi:hypothetical protein